MKTKSPLVLMEQLVMILVFALAAATCLRLFVLSDELSKHYAATDRAVLEAQTVAEQLKHDSLTSDPHESNWEIAFDEDWNPTSSSAPAAYHLSVAYEESDSVHRWCAIVTVCTTDGDELITLPVSGQITEGGAANG